MTIRGRLLALFGLLVLAHTDARAEEATAASYPNRSVRIVVPFPAGGPADVLGRIIAQKLSRDWGQPVVIDNRPGANTVVGAQAVAVAPADGYTLLMAIDSTLAMNQHLYKKLPYDPIDDFAPVALVAKTMTLLVVNADSEFRTVGDLIRKQKAEPDKLNYGAGTITTQLAGFMFNKAAGTRAQLVRYSGSAPVAQGLLTNSIQYAIVAPAAALSLVQSGRLRALAKFDPRPFPPLPDLPQVSEGADLRDFGEVTVWLGIVAPKATPAAIIAKLQEKITSTLNDPEIKSKADATGLFPETSTAAEFSAFIRQEASKWEPVVRESGVRYD